jgi:DNA polymerase alpha subunit A
MISRILTSNIAKKNRQEEQAKRDANDQDISEFFKDVSRKQSKPKVHSFAHAVLE